MMLVCAVLLIVVQSIIIWRQRLNTAWWQDCWENLSMRNSVLQQDNARLLKQRDAAMDDLVKLRLEIKTALDPKDISGV